MRSFELTGLVGLDEYGDIKSLVGASRRAIERSWAAHMTERGWLQAVVANDHVFIVANAGTENAFRRVVDLRDLGQDRLPEPDPRTRFDLDSSALIVEGYVARSVSINLPGVLFRDSWFSGEDA